jgi:K+-transporting ATPase KdpF subunit
VRAPVSLFDLILGAGMSVGLTVYLIYALIRPEKF